MFKQGKRSAGKQKVQRLPSRVCQRGSLLPFGCSLRESYALRANSSQPLSIANVVLDGKTLFKVGNDGKVTAAQRANQINRVLEQKVRSLEVIELEVVGTNQQATIWERTSQRHLLTVSKADVFSADSAIAQAELWRDRLEAALEQGQLERSSTYVVQAWIYTLGAVLGALALHLSLQVLSHFPKVVRRIPERVKGQREKRMRPSSNSLRAGKRTKQGKGLPYLPFPFFLSPFPHLTKSLITFSNWY